MAFLSPKMTLFLLLISVWGTIQLGLMAVFLSQKSMAFAEDIEVTVNNNDFRGFYAEADRSFNNYSSNCAIAALLYLFTFILAIHQFYMNRSELTL